MPLLDAPEQICNALPCAPSIEKTIAKARQSVINILEKKDRRYLVIVGPCSIHHVDSAIAYAKKLREKALEHSDTLHIIMRAYLEKSRTKMNWKGFVYDPDCDGSNNIKKGIYEGRSLLLEINKLGMPVAMEMVSPFVAPYLADLITWGAIGARTTESQLHRELAAQLPFPLGIKDTTGGNILSAIDAAEIATHPQTLMGINHAGILSLIQTPGNPYCHVVLRGSTAGANYDENTVQKTCEQLRARKQIDRVMIDCSHGNAQKEIQRQYTAATTIIERIRSGHPHYLGLMLESHLNPGQQLLTFDAKPHAEFSITDPCLGWENTVLLLDKLSSAIKEGDKAFQQRKHQRVSTILTVG